MELATILNRCHRFRGFVYEQARFSADKKNIEVVVQPRKGSAAVCSRCHQRAAGYDQLAERRFEFIPLWGFFVFLLHAMRRVNCRRCGVVAVEDVPWGDGIRTLTKAYMLFLARWARHLSWKEKKPPSAFVLPGTRYSMRLNMSSVGDWSTARSARSTPLVSMRFSTPKATSP
jgi:transposase